MCCFVYSVVNNVIDIKNMNRWVSLGILCNKKFDLIMVVDGIECWSFVIIFVDFLVWNERGYCVVLMVLVYIILVFFYKIILFFYESWFVFV